MYDFDDTSPSALLHAFLEGDLDPFEEPRLFGMLAESAELRAEMCDCLLIGNAVEQDSERLVPGSHLHDAISAKLGLAAPAEAPHVAAPVPFWSARLAGVALLSAILAALLTLGVMKLVEGTTAGGAAPDARGSAGTAGMTTGASTQRATRAPEGATRATEGAAATGAEPALAASTGSTARHAGGGIDGGHSESGRRAAANRDDDDRADPNVANDGGDENALIATPSEPARVVEPASPRRIAAARPKTARAEPADPATNGVPLNDIPARDEDNGERGMFLEANGLTASSFPSVIVGPPSDPLFNNMSAAVGYRLSPVARVALEVGEEPFAQRYRGMEGSRGATYSQKPLLVWAGVSFRFDLESASLFGIHPYAKLIAGGTGVGPLFKGALGLGYQPDARVGFSLGLEGSMLPYRFQGNWFSTQKLGATYGVSLLF